MEKFRVSPEALKMIRKLWLNVQQAETQITELKASLFLVDVLNDLISGSAINQIHSQMKWDRDLHRTWKGIFEYFDELVEQISKRERLMMMLIWILPKRILMLRRQSNDLRKLRAQSIGPLKLA